jgi:rsbT co-antagonist protein RsbR
VIIDITGVPLIDTAVASHLLQAAAAARLLGAETVLVGVSPEVAQTIVQLGVDVGDLTIRSNLQAGVDYAIRHRHS